MTVIRNVDYRFEMRPDVLDRINSIIPAHIPSGYAVKFACDDTRWPALQAELDAAVRTDPDKYPYKTWLSREYSSSDLEQFKWVSLLPRHVVEPPDLQRDFPGLYFETPALMDLRDVDVVKTGGRWALTEQAKQVIEACNPAGVSFEPAKLFDPEVGDTDDWTEVGGRWWEMKIPAILPPIQPRRPEDLPYSDILRRFVVSEAAPLNFDAARISYGEVSFADEALVVSHRLWKQIQAARLGADFAPAEIASL